MGGVPGYDGVGGAPGLDVRPTGLTRLPGVRVPEHLSASWPLFPQDGGLRPRLGPIPLAFILTLLLKAIPLALSAFLGGREGKDAARLGRGATGRSWSLRPALEKRLLCRGFS